MLCTFFTKRMTLVRPCMNYLSASTESMGVDSNLGAMEESTGVQCLPRKPKTSKSTRGFSCLERNGDKSLLLAAFKRAVIIRADNCMRGGTAVGSFSTRSPVTAVA